MRKRCSLCCLLAGCFLPATSAAIAQEVVHALCGTVRAINPPAKTITVTTDDGSEGLFKDFVEHRTSLDFDKRIRAEAMSADAFAENGARVIVYYFGNDTARTAVALQNLGTGQFDSGTGTVIKYYRNEHLLTIRNQSGVDQSFLIGPKTVAETAMGAVQGSDFDLEDGEQVRVIAKPEKGTETALFVSAM